MKPRDQDALLEKVAKNLETLVGGGGNEWANKQFSMAVRDMESTGRLPLK